MMMMMMMMMMMIVALLLAFPSNAKNTLAANLNGGEALDLLV